MKYTMGFIGAGNMGGALAKAAIPNVGAQNVVICGKNAQKAAEKAKALGCACASSAEIAASCRYIFLGVKPQVMPEMLAEIAPVLKERTDRFILVTMAAGLSISAISEMAGGKYPTIRIMPNMPVSVGEGMTLYVCCPIITDAEKAEFLTLMASAGQFEELPEKLIDAGCALSGCSPAFAFIFAEALADGGVECGLPRETAKRLAAQTLLGSAKMALADSRHSAELKDAVCSPGGTTIAGVHALESGGFRALCMDAVTAAFEKNSALAKK